MMMWARAVRSVSVSVSAAGVALCEGAPKRRLSTPPPRRRVTPVVDLERDVIVLERQIAGEPLTRVTLSAMVDDMADPDRKLLLFGEQHDDAVAQDVQRAVYDDLTRRRTEKLALALEFVDADARDAARAFSDGSSDDVDALFHGAGDARKYGPLALQARATRNELIAANAPRRHARLVAREGPGALANLPPADIAKLPPLPYASAPLSRPYAERLSGFGFGANKIAAQCLWDAAMAHACLDFLRRRPRDCVMLVCGRFHVEHFLGVVDHVEHLGETGAFDEIDREGLRVVVCASVDAQEFARRGADGAVFDDPGFDSLADFVILTRRAPP